MTISALQFSKGQQSLVKIYTNLTKDLLHCANEKINEFIESYFEFNDNHFSNIPPNIIYVTKEKQCRQAAKDLYLWSKDDFVHNTYSFT